MSVPDKARNLGLACLAVLAASIAAAPSAQASILEELREMTRLEAEGELDRDDVSMMKRLVEYTVRIPVHGKQERKQVRYAHLRLLLDGDRAQAYEQYGWPTHRLQVDEMGGVTEHWIYDALQTRLVFRDNRLIDRRRS
jgi:hypothetical protein